MNENKEIKGKVTQKEETKIPDIPEPKFDDSDWFLQTWVNMVNHSEEEAKFPIALFVRGIIISGDLISGKEYFNLFGESLIESVNKPSDEFSKQIKEDFKKYEDIYKVKDNDKKEDQPPPSYIHLKNAKILEADKRPMPQGKGLL